MEDFKPRPFDYMYPPTKPRGRPPTTIDGPLMKPISVAFGSREQHRLDLTVIKLNCGRSEYIRQAVREKLDRDKVDPCPSTPRDAKLP
jgi:hypothetical protein